MTTTAHAKPPAPGPAWEIATLFPDQGAWTEADYFELKTNRLVELSDGIVEVLPMPTVFHQRIVAFLYNALLAFVTAQRAGEVLFAPLRVRLWKGKIREPDIVFIAAGRADRVTADYCQGADLVVEVVSETGRERDEVVKREEYARAGIPEYWIIDPDNRLITVLKLAAGTYAVHGVFASGQRAASATLPGFEVEVDAVWAAAMQR